MAHLLSIFTWTACLYTGLLVVVPSRLWPALVHVLKTIENEKNSFRCFPFLHFLPDVMDCESLIYGAGILKIYIEHSHHSDHVPSVLGNQSFRREESMARKRILTTLQGVPPCMPALPARSVASPRFAREVRATPGLRGTLAREEKASVRSAARTLLPGGVYCSEWSSEHAVGGAAL